MVILVLIYLSMRLRSMMMSKGRSSRSCFDHQIIMSETNDISRAIELLLEVRRLAAKNNFKSVAQDIDSIILTFELQLHIIDEELRSC